MVEVDVFEKYPSDRTQIRFGLNSSPANEVLITLMSSFRHRHPPLTHEGTINDERGRSGLSSERQLDPAQTSGILSLFIVVGYGSTATTVCLVLFMDTCIYDSDVREARRISRLQNPEPAVLEDL